MHARVVTFTGARDIDGGLAFLRERLIPLLREQDGYRGLSASADRDNGVFAVLSLWETAAALEGSDAVLTATRSDAAETIGGELSVGTFEQLVAEFAEPPPAPGTWLMVTPVNMDPARVDDNIAFFRSEVAPHIKAGPGFRGLRTLIDRASGHGVAGSVWADRQSMQRADEDAASRREAARARGVAFGDVSFREILLVDAG